MDAVPSVCPPSPVLIYFAHNVLQHRKNSNFYDVVLSKISCLQFPLKFIADIGYEQLCATGTVGIAAVGLALGQRKNPTDRRSDSSKRKVPPRIPSDEPRSSPMASATVSPLPQPASAPTTRLRKRTSFGRPLSSSSRLSLGTLTGRSISDVKESQGRGHTAQSAAEDARPSFSHEPFEFEAGGTNTFRSSWLRRKSTLSMAKDESPTSTPPTGSPSISFSNRSTAPILSTTHSPSTVPRNRLVKRSSSQRALQGGNTMHSSLRRPATSHQALQPFSSNASQTTIARSTTVPFSNHLHL